MMKTKKVIHLVIALVMVFCFFPGARATEANSTTFKIAVLPDTQNYSQFYPDIFEAQTQWIADNHESENIKFVVHLGDVTNSNNATQWQNAQDAMRILDGKVPYSITVGNHDMGLNGSASDRDTSLFNTYFPLSHYSSTATFGGVYPDEPTKYDNNYHTFSAGGTDWLVLSLEFGPRDQVLDWANEVVASHPNHRVIVVTHAYMFNDETRINSGHFWNPHNYGVASQPGGVNDGEEMWQKFVRLHPNISMVLSGHVLSDGQGKLISVGDHGNKVFQMLANYQDMGQGGDGYIRLLEIDTATGIIVGTTYSPYLDDYKTDWQNNFFYVGFDFGPPAASNKPVLFDNFNDGNLDGWTVVDEGTIEGPSDWVNFLGAVAQTSNIYGPSVLATSNRKGTFAYYDKPAAMNWSNYSLEAILHSTDDDGIGLMFYYQDPDNYYKVELDNQRNFTKLFKMKNGVETTLASISGAYTVNTTFKLKISVHNGKIRVEKDGVDLFGTITDTDLTGGTVAMYCWGNSVSLFDDVRVRPNDMLLYDDFSDGDMNGWTVVDQGTISAPSAWSVIRHEVRESSNIHGPINTAVDNRKGTIAYYNNADAFTWTDYSLYANLRSTDNDGIGLVFRYQDANNYYKLEFDAEKNFVKLFKVVGGVESTIASNTTGTAYIPGANFPVEIRVNGNQIQAFASGLNIFGSTIVDSSLSSGTVGMYSWGNQNSYFDEIIVNPL